MVYSEWGQDGAAFIDEYRRRCITPGRQVLIDHDGQRLQAQAISISDSYGLNILWPDGRTEEKSFGEILQLV
jgi:biotin-(acetyl-CoA carboxylase) ligase